VPEGHIRRHEQPSNIFSPFQEDPIAHLKMCSPSDFRVKNVGSRNSSCSSSDANVTLWRASRRLPGTPIRGLDGCHHHVRRPCSPTLAPKKMAAKSQKQQMLTNISASVRGNAAAFEPAASVGARLLVGNDSATALFGSKLGRCPPQVGPLGCHGEGLGTPKLVASGGLARPRPGFICGGPWMRATFYYLPKFHGFGGAARGRQHDPEVNQ
jgi:hypothetical protein